ncbi:MAG: HpcH/HpaI aldolase family protein [Acetobacteraceae bacterium]
MFDPTTSTLRFKVESGAHVSVVWLNLGSPALAEIAARAQPDAIVLDAQHGLWDRAGMEYAVGLAAPVPVLVRVAANDATAIGQALDAGAEGVIVPLIESGEEAERAAAYARFPPKGIRSGGAIRALTAGLPASLANARRNTVVIAMIETAKGMRRARDVAEADGVDMVLIGGGDLAISLGTDLAGDPRHEQACQDIRAACAAAWMPCGIFTPTPEEAARRRAEGWRMTVAASDLGLLSGGFRSAVAKVRGA